MATPRHEQMYVAADTEMNKVEMACDECGKTIIEGGTISLEALLDAASTHRGEHMKGEHG